MIVRSGTAASFVVEFSLGSPDDEIDWQLLDEDGTQITSGSVTPDLAAVSAVITVPAIHNTLSGGSLITSRDLVWTYSVNGSVVNDERRYDVEARIPFGVSPQGVRNLLGVDHHDIADENVSLISAYTTFVDLTNGLPIVVSSGEQLKVRRAVEALAALELIPTMQVRVALKEQSGNDMFQRDKTDWLGLAAHLEGIVAEGVIIIDPSYDPTSTLPIFIIASPVDDPFPGA